MEQLDWKILKMITKSKVLFLKRQANLWITIVKIRGKLPKMQEKIHISTQRLPMAHLTKLLQKMQLMPIKQKSFISSLIPF
jgi:hypothetical protein